MTFDERFNHQVIHYAIGDEFLLTKEQARELWYAAVNECANVAIDYAKNFDTMSDTDLASIGLCSIISAEIRKAAG